MSTTVQGTIQRKGFGTGTWALVSDSGETYELRQLPQEFQKTGLKVKIAGQIRNDIMTLAMIGPVLEVQQSEQIS